MSRQAMFPKPERTEYYTQTKISSHTPPPIIVNKAMGSFARREIVTPVVNSRTSPPQQQQVQPVMVTISSETHKEVKPSWASDDA